MWRTLPLLALCCAVSGLEPLEADRSFREKMLLAETGELRPSTEAPSAGRTENSQPAPEKGTPGGVQQPTAEPLEDELDIQENIISQVSVL